MRRTPLLLAIGAGLFAAVVVSGWQAASNGALSGDLRGHVKNEQFGIVTSIRGLPLGVRDTLQRLFGTSSLDIAEPGTPYQSSAASGSSKLPIRRLVAAGCSTNRCLVYYERGGDAPSWRVALFHWTPEETRLEWSGMAPGGLATIEDVRKAVLAGSVKGDVTVW
jgi:hypothetical protein